MKRIAKLLRALADKLDAPAKPKRGRPRKAQKAEQPALFNEHEPVNPAQ